MRLLANENIPGVLVEALRDHGHEVAWVRAEAPGSTDEDVIRQAAAQSRILLTFDKDFGDLVFRRGVSMPVGLILLRFASSSPAHVVRIVVEALDARSDWAGHFAVIEERQVRMTRLPSEPA